MPDPLPMTVRCAVGILLGEAATIGVVTLVLALDSTNGRPSNQGNALAVVVYALALGVALGFLGVSLARRRAWVRGPVIALHLIALPIAYYMIGGGLAWLGLLIGALALAVIGLLIAPSTRDALGIHERKTHV